MPLRALLEEKSVSRAAERLRVSQPSLSAALAKLRLHFDDPLLDRRGRRYELTPLAAQLLEHSYSAELSLERLFGALSNFDPASTEREFSLFVTDYGAAVLAPVLIRELAAQAPKARLRLNNMLSDTVVRAPDSIRDYDGLVMPHGFFHSSNLDLFRDRWLCMVSIDNTEVASELTLDQLSTLAWVFTYDSPTEYTLAAKHLGLLGIEPRVEVVAPSFLALPFLLAGTNRVALVQQSLGLKLATTGLVRLLESPIPLVEIQEAMWWHQVHDLNPEHMWFRSVVGAAAQRLIESGDVKPI
ncbi:LysR family transcriptional regulator [Subtercola sp. YIM 133946]|uniref:LysR family transcriptional regulator n=1 Tax=Subtercola sp. YIM 133946 TaxID=3118909 RepID=UPI002F948E97